MKMILEKHSPDSHPDKVSKSFCAYAFKQLHVTPSGVVKPCCLFDGPMKNSDGTTIRIGDSTVEEIWNSKAYKDLRLKMINGEAVQECSKCIEEEKNYDASDRILNGRYESFMFSRVEEARNNEGALKSLPDYLNLKLGNTCNLKCRMCQPLDSISIDSEFSQISKQEPAFRTFDNANSHDYFYDTEPLETATNWIENKLALNNIQKLMSRGGGIQQGVTLSLAGGEVTYTPQAIALLDFCIDNKYAPMIYLTLSTNLTKLTDEFLEKLSKFRAVTVICSIDGIGKTLEYIRYPSQWDIVYKNYIKLLNGPDHILPVLSPTIQNYNILEVDKILELVENINDEKFVKVEAQLVHLTILYDPHHLNIRFLPQKIKDIAYERIVKFSEKSKHLKTNIVYAEQIKLLLETLKAVSPPEEINKYMSYFMQYTESLDRSRNQKFSQELPELAALLSEYNFVPAYPKNIGNSFSYYRFRDNGFVAKENGNYKAAKKYFRKAYELFQNDEDLLFNMAANLEFLDEHDNAEKIFMQLFTFNPKNYYCLLSLGFLNKRKNNLAEAKEYFFLAMGNEPFEKKGEAEKFFREIK